MNRKSNIFKRHTEIVYSACDPVTVISKSDIEFLREISGKSQEGKARVLLHQDPQAGLHEMLIIHTFGRYIQPHINDQSAKSFLVLLGEMIVVLYDSSGSIQTCHRLSGLKDDSPFYLRLEEPIFHTLVPVTNTVAFIETITGPHVQTNYATFAPSPNDTSEANKYMTWLMGELSINLNVSRETV
jgi:cupin fold WbuC family metalloprotein